MAHAQYLSCTAVARSAGPQRVAHKEEALDSQRRRQPHDGVGTDVDGWVVDVNLEHLNIRPCSYSRLLPVMKFKGRHLCLLARGKAPSAPLHHHHHHHFFPSTPRLCSMLLSGLCLFNACVHVCVGHQFVLSELT